MAKQHKKMSRKKHQFPAFTMIELIAVLILSGIIFSMAMLVINIMQQQGQLQEKEHVEVLALQQLGTLLKRDSYLAKSIWLEQEQLFFEQEPYVVRYTIKNQAVCRSILMQPIYTDTFSFSTVAFQPFWQAQAVEMGRVDQIELSVELFEQPYVMNITKVYDQKTLLEAKVETEQ